jgi:hypothetical protein
MKNKMRRITINIECCKKECGRCFFCRYVNENVMKSFHWACDIFNAVLDETPGGTVLRCRQCLKKEQKHGKE